MVIDHGQYRSSVNMRFNAIIIDQESGSGSCDRQGVGFDRKPRPQRVARMQSRSVSIMCSSSAGVEMNGGPMAIESPV
jgi:hypothetical protein